MKTKLITEELHDLVDPNRESCCLHSLGNKCKEWVRNKDYEILSFLSKEGTAHTAFLSEIIHFPKCSDIIQLEEWTMANTEPEAIFKACQWILDNKE